MIDSPPPKEIERKFLIRMPDFSRLSCKEGYHADGIVQTYLRDPAATTRVRRRERNGQAVYTKTSKIRINALTAWEEERVLTAEEYGEELKNADLALSPIRKVRHVFRENGLIFEIDVYPFWDRIAVLETELEREDQPVRFPREIEVIAEVTADRRFKNRGLAESIPDVTPYLN